MSISTQPKLIPIWHDVTLNEDRNKYPSGTFGPEFYPDHGGAGVDVFLINNSVECEHLKSTVNTVNYGSEMCSLPFLPPNKVNSMSDPCLKKLYIRRKKQKKFCGKFQIACNHLKWARGFRKRVLSSHEEAPELIASGKSDELLVPPSVVEMAKTFPKRFPVPNARWEFVNGCLATFSSSASHYLLHPVGRKLSQLALTPFEERSDELKPIVAEITSQKKVPVKGGKIFQIEVNSSLGVSCVRKNKKYHYVNLHSVLEGKSELCSVQSYSFEEKLTNVKLSPYVPGEHLVVTSSGLLLLENAQLKKRVWQIDEPLVHYPLNDSFWCCDFGAHPRSILYLNQQQFTSLDLRMKWPKAVDIFSIPSNFTIDKEQLTVMKHVENSAFQHFAATNFHLFLFDERYPQQPLMSWSHMLGSFPLYCDIKPFSVSSDYSDCVVLLASQESADIASFHLRIMPSRVQPFSLSQPLHLSVPQDCIKNLKLHCQDVDDRITGRLSSSLIGVCAVPHSYSTGYTVLQLTSFGDIFYQPFKPVSNDEKTYRVGPGCILLPPDKLLPHMSSWLKVAVADMKENSKESKKITYVNINKKKFLNGENIQSANCLLCKSKGLMPNVKECDSDICPHCGLHTVFGKQLIQCSENCGVVLRGTLPQDNDNGEASQDDSLPLQLVDLTKLSDPLSKRFLRVWDDDEVMTS